MSRQSMILFRGGPLDGAMLPKGGSGRWALGVNEEGKTIPLDSLDRRIRRGERNFYVQIEKVPTTDGSMVRRYRWAADPDGADD